VSIKVENGSFTVEIREDAEVKRFPARSLRHAQAIRNFLGPDVYEGSLTTMKRS